MKNNFRNFIFILILIGVVMPGIKCGQNLNEKPDLKDSIESKIEDRVWTAEEEEVKATVERFLTVAGNYDLDAMSEMITDKANLGIVRYKEGTWSTSTITIEEYFEGVKKRKVRPYYEPVSEYTIHISEGHLAFVKADAILYTYGVPRSHNIDFFTLIKEDGAWRFLNLSFTSNPITTDEMEYDLMIFGKSYAQAWCSQRPEFVSLFFAEDGSLSVNNGDPAEGREEISKVAASFMAAFPDMTVTMDSLPKTADGIAFHWTLTGTNTGPNGTGNKVKISGVELWQFDDKGLIKKSEGSFNAEEYNRQLKYGFESD